MTVLLFFYSLMLKIGFSGLILCASSFIIGVCARLLPGDKVALGIVAASGIAMFAGLWLLVIASAVGIVGILATAIYLAVT